MSPQRTDMLTGIKLKTTFLYLVNHAFKIRALPLNFIAIKTKIHVYYLQMVSDYWYSSSYIFRLVIICFKNCSSVSHFLVVLRGVIYIKKAVPFYNLVQNP